MALTFRPARAGPAVLAGLAAVGIGLAVAPPSLPARTALALGWPAAAAALAPDPLWRGTALHAAGRYPEAAAAFGEAPGARAAYNRGNALALSGRFGEAVAAYDAALARDPGDEDAQANRELVARLAEGPPSPGGRTAGEANARADQSTRYATRTASDPDDPGNASTGEGLAGNREASAATSSPGTSKAARAGRAEQARIDPGRGQARGSAGDAEGGGRSGGGNASVSRVVEREVRRISKSFEAREIRADRHWLTTLPDDPGRLVRLRLRAERERREEAGTAVQPGSDPW
ncbi:MAG: tetratricopeptide repeat protein [Methylobacterium frigidaeris]